MKHLLAIAFCILHSSFFVLHSFAVTATKEYVDRKDQALREDVEKATNTLDKAYSPRVEELEAHGYVKLVGIMGSDAESCELYFVFPGGDTLPTEGTRVRITSLINTEAPYTQDTLRVNHDGSLDVWGAGGTFLVNTKNDDEGVWIESRLDKSLIINGKITASTGSTFDASFRANPYFWRLIEQHGGRLVLATRGGLDKNYGVVIAKRDITVQYL